jgi:hypothetical protein
MVPVIDATGQLQALRDQKVIWRLQRESGLGSGSRFARSETAEEAALSYRPYSREAIRGAAFACPQTAKLAAGQKRRLPRHLASFPISA